MKRRQGVPYPLEEAVTVIDPQTMHEVPRDDSFCERAPVCTTGMLHSK